MNEESSIIYFSLLIWKNGIQWKEFTEKLTKSTEFSM